MNFSRKAPKGASLKALFKGATESCRGIAKYTFQGGCELGSCTTVAKGTF